MSNQRLYFIIQSGLLELDNSLYDLNNLISLLSENLVFALLFLLRCVVHREGDFDKLQDELLHRLIICIF